MARAKSTTLPERAKDSYADTGKEKHLVFTLSTAGTSQSITVPDWAQGVKLYPRTNAVRFAIGIGTARTVAASAATSSDASVDVDDFGIGGIAKPDQWEVRTLPSNTASTTRYIQLVADTNSTVVDVELF